jgi:pimeloyl-ACP methyl ester carboxylesterase
VRRAAPAPLPIVLLHQTPRSWREYAEVLPLLGARGARSPSTPRGSASRTPVADASIEAWAEAALQLLDAIGVTRAHVVGHHTGGVIAVEMAARAPGARRLARALVDAVHERGVPAGARRRAAIDAVAPSDDGSHLAALWQKRQPFYPAGRPICCRRSSPMR